MINNSMTIQCQNVLDLNLHDPISSFDDTERTYRVSATMLMTLEEFYQLSKFMQKHNTFEDTDESEVTCL